MNNSELTLRSQLLRETIADTVLYYSLVKKESKTLTFLTNDRLLIYDDKRRILFYINQFKNTPFRTAAPNPKNQVCMPINFCNFSNPATTNKLMVNYTVRNSKGQLETTEWNFEFDSQQLTVQWMKLLQAQKNKLVENATGQKGAGFIHDTLLDAMQYNKQPSLKQTILKPEEQVIKTVIYPEQSQIKNSRISDPKRSNIHPSHSVLVSSQSNLRQSNREIRPQEGRNDNINYSYPGVKPTPQINTSSLRETQNIRGSNLKPIEGSRINQSRQSRQRQHQQKNNTVDWNHRFLKQPTEATLYSFEEAAFQALKAIWAKDYNSLHDPRRVYESNGLIIAATNCFTKQAALLKRQFRNYHFILEACKNKLVVGVPLCSLIQWQGVVCLVKAPIPIEAQEVRLNQVALEVRELERYTRVSNNAIEKGSLWDLTNLYGPNADKKLIYVDRLTDYLPIHLDEEMNGSSLRPEYLLDSVNQVIPGGDTRGGSRQEQKQIATACEGLNACIKELADYLNSQETLWIDSLELKEIFHNFGVNFKLLPRVYTAVGNKQVKRCLQSVMAAKVAKDNLYETLFQNRKEDTRVRAERVIEDYIGLLMEGNNSNSSEIWKEINLRFKKQYSAPISNSELIPGFFLNSLLKLLKVRVDMSKFVKGKKPFVDQGIIKEGFVVAVNPKIKTYCRFSTQFIEKIRYACRDEKKDRDIYDEIIAELQLQSKDIPTEYTLNNNYQPILEYLAYYTPPSQLDSNAQLRNIPIYQAYLREPPSAFSLRITKSYLEWAIKRQKTEQFKKGIEDALKLSDFWLDNSHIFQADLFQLLSDFYSSQGNYEESINFMKQALSKTIKSCGTQSRKAGTKYYQLGERELRAGRKKEALENFNKAKTNMVSNKNTSIKYPLLLMRISSLHLNSGNIEGSIEEALDSIKNFDDYDKQTGSPSLTEGYKVKTFQVLARAYEISGRKNQLKDMALICAKKFNKSKMQWTYQQMVRICLAAAIYYHSTERCEFFLNLCSRLKKEDQQSMDSATALKEMMTISQSFIAMEKFLIRFDSLQRIAGQGASKKPISQDSRDFLFICRRVAAVVGEDYIEGLVQQKQYE